MSITGSNNPFACNPVVFANANSIVSLGTITRSIVNPNQFIFSVGFKWKINGVLYQNTAPITITIAEASEGFKRIDNALLNTSNTIELQQGLESATVALQPVAPDTNIILTSWNISGDEIEDTETPIVGNQFVKKSFSAPFISAVTGADAIIPLDPNGYSEIRLTNASLTSIAGFDLSLITGVPTAEVPYNGKPYIIRNLTGNDITIKNELGAADFPFYLSGGADLVFQNGQAIYVLYDAAGFNEIFKSWSEVDLSTKADLVGGKVPASQLPAYVDDVLEFANKASFPVIGESGKIYIALNSGFTYSWSGSAYVQIGGSSKKTDKITYTHTSYNNINVLNTWFRFYNSQGWNNNVINANSETGSTPNLIFTNGSSRPILPNSKLVRCVLSINYASVATPSSFEVYVGTSEFTEGVVNASGGINQQTLVLETVNFTSSIYMNLIKNLTINPHSTLPFNKLYFAIREKANTKFYSFQLDFYFEEQ